MLGSRWYAGGFLHHGMLGGTTLYTKEGCKSYSKKDKVCSKGTIWGTITYLLKRTEKAGNLLFLNIRCDIHECS